MRNLENMIIYLKEKYPPGTRIRLNEMADPYSPVPPGTEGVVTGIDSMGTIHMDWSNGRTLGLIYGEDSFIKIGYESLEMSKEADQIDKQDMIMEMK